MSKALIIKDGILASLAIIGSFVTSLLGGWDKAMQTLIIFMTVDYLTGLLIAAVWQKSPKTSHGALESRAGFKGLCRKVIILLAVLIGNQLDIVLHSPGLIRTAVILFFIGNEGISVIENMGIMGVPMPDIVRKSFEQLKAKGAETVPIDDDEGAS